MPGRIYVGSSPKTFVTGGVGRLVPGQRFDCPEDLCEAFDRRADIAVPAAEYDADVTAAEEAAAAASAEASASQAADVNGGRPSGGRGRPGSPAGKNGTGATAVPKNA